MNIPGFRYKKKELNTLSNRIGEFIMTLGMEMPFVTIGRFEPTNALAWIIHGMVMFTVMTVWMFSIGWLLIGFGLVIDMIEESFNNMRRR